MKTPPKLFLLGLSVLMLMTSACSAGETAGPPTIPPTEIVQESLTAAPAEAAPPAAREIFDFSSTGFGFFPTPPQPTVNSSTQNIKAMSEHADVLLFQEAVPWEVFQAGVEVESSRISGIGDIIDYAGFYGMQPILVIDPLNGLDRREFQGLPETWGEADFSNSEIRTAYKNFAVRIAREFKPHYLGLASEINTYLDAFPEDQEHFLSLYRETYAAVKAESPETRVFATFQWDDLNRLDGDGTPYDVKWDQIEAFEPQLDIWAISTYPHFFFEGPDDIPDDYYTRLIERTDKELAVAESGWTSEDAGAFSGTPGEQVDFLLELDAQIGESLVFWINLIYANLDWDAYRLIFEEQGVEKDMETLSNFVYLGLINADGTPKPALETWDTLRRESR
ncbi:MAG: hypothetical protein U5K99_08395 [Anaerolineales bacterium]|nr:hypothetical protein [Anaerolineales bacterium]